MKELIINNMESIIMLIIMGITWLFGKITKNNKKISNKLIPFQSILIAVIATLIYYYATDDWSMVIASGSPIATLLYDLVHTYNKDKKEKEDSLEYGDEGEIEDEL